MIFFFPHHVVSICWSSSTRSKSGSPEKDCLYFSRINKANALVVSKSKPLPKARHHGIQQFLVLQEVRRLNHLNDRLVALSAKKTSSRTPASLSPTPSISKGAPRTALPPLERSLIEEDDLGESQAVHVWERERGGVLHFRAIKVANEEFSHWDELHRNRYWYLDFLAVWGF